MPACSHPGLTRAASTRRRARAQEPLLPPLETPADLRPEHVAWAEDACIEFLSTHAIPVSQVGWLVDAGAATGDRAQRAQAQAEQLCDAAQALHEEDEASAAPETGVTAA